MLKRLTQGLISKLENIAEFFEEYASIKAKIATYNKRAEELSAVIKKYMQDSGAKNYNIASSGKFLQEGYEVSAIITYPNKSVIDTADVVRLHGQEFFNKNATISKKALEESLTEEQIDALVKKVVSKTPTLNISTFIPQQDAEESEIPDLGSFE